MYQKSKEKLDGKFDIFLLGDFETDNGPGIANKHVRDSLNKLYKTKCSMAHGKVRRILEAIKYINNSNVLLICSVSKLNYLAVQIAKAKNKPIIYLMHGYASYEAEIANPYISESELLRIRNYEKFIYDASFRIVCVSKYSMAFMKKRLPQYTNKLDYIYNVIDITVFKKICQEKKTFRKQKRILSVGGGMKQKRNLVVAKSVDKYFVDLEFVVVGFLQEDGEEIKSLNCVTWFNHLSHEKLCQLMSESDIYIQNSIFETFGLAIIEALYAGCSILISKHVGCIDLFDSITEHDIIYDVEDEKEIANKIRHLLQNPNNHRMLNGFRNEQVSEKFQADRWNGIIKKVM